MVVLMRAVVVLDTRFGNTKKIGRSLGTGLMRAGIQTTCIHVKEVAVEEMGQYDLICVGEPTQYRTATRPIQDFLSNLKSANLSGKQAFASTRAGTLTWRAAPRVTSKRECESSD